MREAFEYYTLLHDKEMLLNERICANDKARAAMLIKFFSLSPAFRFSYFFQFQFIAFNISRSGGE